MYLTALVRRLVSTCSIRTASPSIHAGSVLTSISPIESGAGGDRRDGPADQLLEVLSLSIQPELAGDDALDVDQIIDQTGDVVDLPGNHVAGARVPCCPRAA